MTDVVNKRLAAVRTAAVLLQALVTFVCFLLAAYIVGSVVTDNTDGISGAVIWFAAFAAALLLLFILSGRSVWRIDRRGQICDITNHFGSTRSYALVDVTQVKKTVLFMTASVKGKTYILPLFGEKTQNYAERDFFRT